MYQYTDSVVEGVPEIYNVLSTEVGVEMTTPDQVACKIYVTQMTKV